MASETTGTFIPIIPAHQLLCHRCRYFCYAPGLAWCFLREPAFPALCVRYEYADGQTINANGAIAKSRPSE